MVPQIYNGNIFDSVADVICHQVNCQGVMGAGIALQIKKRYPIVYEKYKEYCDSNPLYNILGTAQIVQVDRFTFVANLFAQETYGKLKPGTTYTNYTALKNAFIDISINADKYGYRSIAIPYGIGCGLAGGDWDKVWGIINEVFMFTSLSVQVWRLR